MLVPPDAVAGDQVDELGLARGVGQLDVDVGVSDQWVSFTAEKRIISGPVQMSPDFGKTFP